MDNDKYIACYDPSIADKCVYGRSFIKELLGINNTHNEIFYPSPEYPMSKRKLEGFQRLAEYRLYYQENPVKFVRDFFNIEMIDSQAYLFQMAWTTPQVLIVASRAYGKSFWISLFAMAKQMLSATPWICYIASGSSEQSATTFKKLEDIANNRIDSLVGSTGEIFKHEVEIPNAVGDGFSHSPSGFTYTLYNGSFTRTLNSNVDKNRGKRGSCVIFDECGFLSADLIQVYKAFCAVEKGFKTGFDEKNQAIDIVRLATMEKEISNQLIYVSSASNVEMEFYDMFRDFSKQMFMGNKNYFVAYLDCNLVMKPTIHGVPTVPYLSQDKIDSAMRTNPEKALREYYCQFTSDAGASAIIKRSVITRNEETRVPLLYNDTGNRKFIIAYDPARSRDNSVILVGEVYEEKHGSVIDTKMRWVNCINLLDVGKKIKSPMQTPEQIEYLKQVIVDYNGGAAGYSNILGVYIDAGSGGGGVDRADFLMRDWVDKKGVVHRGLIDKEYSADYVRKFPNAVDKIRMIQPLPLKSEIYECLIEMMNQDKISITSTYDNKGYLTVFDVDDKKMAAARKKIKDRLDKENVPPEEYEKQLAEELNKTDAIDTKTVQLDWREEIALANLDAMKEEMVNMIRKPRESGKDSFELTPEKANKLHDDRSYTAALTAYGLVQERKKNMMRKDKDDEDDYLKFFANRAVKIPKGVREY